MSLSPNGLLRVRDLCRRFVQLCQTINPLSFISPADEHPAPIGALESRMLLSANPAIGMNLSGVVDYNPAWTFTDVFQSSRPWIGNTYNTATGVETWGDGGSIQVDQDGWPTQLKQWTNSQGQVLQQRAVTLMLREFGDKYPAGAYRVEWTGAGAVAFAGLAKVAQQGKTGNTSYALLSIAAPGDEGIILKINQTNPTDPVRNIHVWMPGYNGQSFAGQVWRPGAPFSPFHPVFKERLSPFSTLRFMDWSSTKSSTLQYWTDRTTVNHARQANSTTGVAYEYMIQLANELDDDVWLNMPHMANDEFIRNYATLVRDSLEPGRKIHLEWSNEVWNTNPDFNTCGWVTTQLQKPENAGMDRSAFVAREIKRDFDIWSDVFQGQSNRLVRVVAWQAANSWGANEILKNMGGSFDALAAAGYLIPDAGTFSATTTVDEVFAGMRAALPARLGYWRDYRKLADQYAAQLGRPIRLLAYEGGQSLVGRNAPYQQAYYDAQANPQMYDLYKDLLQGFKDTGGDLFMHFNYVDQDTSHGSWGVLQYQTEPDSAAPKYRALLDAVSGKLFNPDAAIETVTPITTEGAATPGVFRVFRGGDLTVPMTVYFNTSGSASAADYTGLPASIYFAANESSKLIQISPIDDTAVEPDETLTITLSATSAYTVDPLKTTASITIKSNDVAPPAAPTGLTANTLDATQISLTWLDNSPNEAGFYVERKAGLTGAWTQLATLGANATTYTNTGLIPNTLYTYRVRCYNNLGNSAYSNEAAATTKALQELIIDNTSPAATITGDWTPSTYTPGYYGPNYLHDGNTAKGAKSVRFTPNFPPGTYEVFIRWIAGNGRANNVPVDVIHNNGAKTIDLDQRTNGGQWISLGIYDFDGIGDSVLIRTTGTNGYVTADAVRFVASPLVPTNLLATPTSSSQVQLAWLDNSANETGFQIERKIGPNGGWTRIATVPNNITTYINSALALNTTYFYRVRAYNSLGISAYSNEAAAATTTSAPTPELILDNTDPAVTLTGDWTPSTAVAGYYGSNYLHDGNTAKGSKGVLYSPSLAPGSYELFLRWTSGSGRASNVPVDIIHDNGTSTIYLDQRANSGQWVSLGIYRFDGIADRVLIRTTATDGHVIADALRFVATLEAPTNLVATAINSSQIALAWLDNSANETGFQIERKIGPGGAWSQIATTPPDTTSYIDTALTPNTLYSYRIQACNAAGPSAYSNESTAATTMEVILDNTDPAVTLTGDWTPSTAVAGYYGPNYLHDGNTGKGSKSVLYSPNLASGSYAVFLRYASASNRATNVPVDIIHDKGSSTVYLDQRTNGGQWVSLGIYSFDGINDSILIHTDGTNGYVIVDAVRFVRISTP